MTILDKMIENCEKAGYATTKNVQKIANAKQMMCGEMNGTVVLATDKIRLAIVYPNCVALILNATVNATVIVIAKKLVN